MIFLINMLLLFYLSFMTDPQTQTFATTDPFNWLKSRQLRTHIDVLKQYMTYFPTDIEIAAVVASS